MRKEKGRRKEGGTRREAKDSSGNDKSTGLR